MRRIFALLISAATTVWIPAASAQGPANQADQPPQSPRDYAKELRDLIMSRRANAVSKPGDQREDLWPVLNQVSERRLAGMFHLVLDSPTLRDWARKQTPAEEEHVDVYSQVCSALKGRLDATPILQEVRTIADRFDNGPFASIARPARTPYVVLPPVSLRRPQGAYVSPGIESTRWFARACVLRAWIAVHDRDHKAFAAAVEECLVAADVLEYEPTAIARASANGIRIFAYQTIGEALVLGKLTSEMRDTITPLFKDPLPASWHHTVQGERLATLEYLEAIFADPQVINRSTGKPEGSDAGMFALMDRMKAPREDCLAHADKYFDFVLSAMSSDPPESASAIKALLGMREQLAGSSPDSKKYPYLAIVLPDYKGVIRIEHTARTAREAIIALLAIEAYRNKHGKPPESLAALVPAFLPEPTKDWFDATRRELRFKPVDPATDELGRSYILYSVGRDGADQGGAEYSGNPWQLAAEDENPCDLVFNSCERREAAKK